MFAAEVLNAVVVGDHRAVELPLAAEDVGKQPLVAGAGYAVDVVIRVHHRLGVRLVDRRFEGEQVRFAEFATTDVDRTPVFAPRAGAVAREVFQRRRDPVAVALKPVDVAAGHRRHEVRFLAERLLDAAPAEVARHVEHRRQRVCGADGLQPAPDRLRDRSHQGGRPRARHPDALRKRRPRGPHVAAQTLLVGDRRDTESSLFFEIPL